jgi:hypothetical protein
VSVNGCKYRVLHDVWIEGGASGDILRTAAHVYTAGDAASKQRAIWTCAEACCASEKCAHCSFHGGYCYLRNRLGSTEHKQRLEGGFSLVL